MCFRLQILTHQILPFLTNFEEDYLYQKGFLVKAMGYPSVIILWRRTDFPYLVGM